MRKILTAIVALAGIVASALILTQSFAQPEPTQREHDQSEPTQSEQNQQNEVAEQKDDVVTAEDLEWMDASDLLPEGAEFAVVEGDLSDEEIAIMRLRLPPDYVIPPHTHPINERVTVLSGTMHFANEAEFDRDVTTRMDPFSYVRAPVEQPHFAWTDEGEGTVMEIVVDGPFAIEYVNPEDDPR